MSTAVRELPATSSFPDMIAQVRASFSARVTRPLAWRREQLKRLEGLIEENTSELNDALRQDLGKCGSESWVTDLGLVRSAARSARKKLTRWSAPERVSNPVGLMPAKSFVMREPLGVILIIAPWNYPVQLTLMPLVAALAAGNCVVIKPSEISAHTSKVLARLIPLYLDSKCVTIMEGGAAETNALLRERFDHIFYTGNATIGRIVMEAASRHLTPVTLELGGKSSCIIDESAEIRTAANRTAFGKFLNAGQTCIAPDYVLVHESREQALLDALAATIRKFFGPDPKSSTDYGRIVNERHFDRLQKLMEGGQVVVGGESDRDSRYIAPTVLCNVNPDSPVMREEIFGPILPVISVPDISAAVKFVNARPKSLALYLFCRSRQVENFVLHNTSSGGVCVNTTLLHHKNDELPFGGVGESGMGSYHGRFGFETFSHKRGVVRKSIRPEIPVAYPPYTKLKDFLLRWLV
ncbi:MAG: aldehyde dehydrogenase family protein [Acidobacteria bacterium]|nr:MAG: aldehyde dehydrogenase family protein [Acidobacteriota bacterium]PYY21865.1 MAG: aldehyde dehydrogenase family protein [Acidobacteriota bacterium]